MSRYVRIAMGTLLLATLPLCAADVAPGANDKKQNSLIDPPEVAIRKFTVAPGLKVDLFAAEPDVRNPVALSIDEHGRVFVVESDRRRSSVFDIRGHKDWLESDFSFRTVQDRINFLKQQVSPTNPAAIKRLTGGGNGSLADFNKDGVIDWRDLEVQSERIRLLEDTNGDGRADRVSVFADGFTNLVAGVAAGVLAQRGDVYFACIPDLWKISKPVNSKSVISGAGRSTLNTGSLITESLITGFGVHIAFGGHDMHGLIFGHDGKLYWSIADRGTDTNLFAKLKNPAPGLTPELLADSGCIFRANPDGSDLEVVAWGLRNPQELAFDDYGNLFTADNNGDGGDKARWHYVVEGADFGWRLGWQWLEARAYQPKMGPWNGERLWHLAESNTAAYLLAPLAHIGHGPSGLAYNPGTGLPASFDRHFFLCDFPGAVLMWTNIPDGASFKVGPVKNLFGDLGPTDVAFHPDGGVLVSDWFKSFDKSDKGRIYRIHDPATDASTAVQETKRLLAEGMAKRSVKELADLLGHRDRRVRLEAQWTLASMTNYAVLSGVANNTKLALLPRIHTIWALEQAIRDIRMGPRQMNNVVYRDEMNALIPLLKDREPEIRAQACKLMASALCGDAQESLRELFSDASPRVQAFAIRAYTRMFKMQAYVDATITQSLATRAQERVRDAVKGNWGVAGKYFSYPGDELRPVLESSATTPYLFHEAVNLYIELVKLFTPARITEAMNSEPPDPRNMRLASLLALRRLGNPAVANFLSDADPQLVLEAARAINDVPIPEAYPALAAKVGQASSLSRTTRDAAATDGSREPDASLSASGSGKMPDLLFAKVGQASSLSRTARDAAATDGSREPNASLSASGSGKMPDLLSAKVGQASSLSRTTRDAAATDGSREPDASLSASGSGKMPDLLFFTLRRALNANFRLGHATNALALAAFAARSDAPEPLRIEALELLGLWAKPPARDHFMGLYRPLPAREGKPAADALRPVLASLLGSAPKDVKLQATKAAAALGVKEADLFALVSDVGQSPEVRVEALKSLAAEKDARLPEALKLALADKSEALRIEAGKLQGGGGDAAAQWAKILESGGIAEKQGVFASLATAKSKTADDLLTKQLDALLAGTLAKELTLDVLDAAKKNSSDAIVSRVKKYEASLPKDDALGPWRMALYGGNAEEGRKVFVENQNVACYRCHKINGEGGEVGSDLTGVGAKRGREYLLESIVFPNKEVAPGFEQALITLKSGTEYAGTVKGETDAEVSLLSAEDGLVKIPKADIKARLKGLSAMPEELGNVLTRRELRDVIEFLDAAR